MPLDYRQSRWAVAVGFFVPLAALLLPDLIMGRFYVFRDAGLYYYPLYEWIGECWRQDGAVPLWNPRENGGLPLTSDPTAALWYPAKWIFAAPLPYHVCFQCFLVGHLIWAWWGLFTACRMWNRSQIAATVAAISYTYGGYVLFQVSNPPYLVGAAWLPWAVAWGELALRRGHRPALLGTAVALAMMMLGGDPQTAYHSLLVLAIYLLWRADWSAWLRLLTISLTMVVLSAVVILPSTTWVDRTERATTTPRSLWDLLDVQRRQGDWRDLLADPEAGEHKERIYRYSYLPTRWGEFLWPNASGAMFPENKRWIKANPLYARTWVPSLYLGLVPLIACLSAFAFRGIDRRRRWMSRVLVFSLLAACGRFGLVALWEWRQGDTWMSGAVGGLYHFLVMTLPGYSFFRYPAKWLLLTSLSMSSLSAWGIDSMLDRESGREPRHSHRSPLALTATATVLTAVFLACHLSGATESWFDPAEVPTDRLFGPLDVEGAWWQVVAANVHTLVAGGLLLALLWRLRLASGNGRNDLRLPRTALAGRMPLGWLLLSLAGIDVLLANRGLTPAISPGRAETRSRLTVSQQPPRRVARIDRTRYTAVQTGDIHAFRWREARARYLPKSHLFQPDIEMIGVAGSAGPLDWQRLRAACDSRERFWQAVGVQDVVELSNRTLPDRMETKWRRLPTAEPRLWLSREAEWISRPEPTNLATADWRRLASRKRGDLLVYGVADSPAAIGAPPETQDALSNSLTCSQYRPNVIRLEIELTHPTWLVVNDRFHEGWSARYGHDDQWHLAKVHVANGWARCVHLPRGNYEVVFEFRPRELAWGQQISGWSALLVFGYLSIVMYQRRKSR